MFEHIWSRYGHDGLLSQSFWPATEVIGHTWWENHETSAKMTISIRFENTDTRKTRHLNLTSPALTFDLHSHDSQGPSPTCVSVAVFVDVSGNKTWHAKLQTCCPWCNYSSNWCVSTCFLSMTFLYPPNLRLHRMFFSTTCLWVGCFFCIVPSRWEIVCFCNICFDKVNTCNGWQESHCNHCKCATRNHLCHLCQRVTLHIWRHCFPQLVFWSHRDDSKFRETPVFGLIN